MASRRQQFEHLDRARGGLDLANAPTFDPLGAVRVARVVFGHWDLFALFGVDTLTGMGGRTPQT